MKEMEIFNQLYENNILFRIGLYLEVILIVCKMMLWLYNRFFEQQLHKSKSILIQPYTAEEIAIIVQKNLVCPFVDKMGTDEQGNMFFQCGNIRYYARINDGKLCIVRKNIFEKDTPHLSETGQELQQCIADIFSDDFEKDREEWRKQRRKYRWFSVAEWASGVACILCFLFIALQLIGGVDVLKSRGVSLAKFTDYSTEYTINDALRSSCKEGKWSSSKEGDNTYAYFTGTTFGGNELVMAFQTDESGYCEIISVQLDGEDYSFLGGLLLEVMYSNIEYGSQ